MACRRIHLGWLWGGWLAGFLGGVALDVWARENHEIAYILAFVYGSTIGAYLTWKFAKWSDDELARRRAEDDGRSNRWWR